MFPLAIDIFCKLLQSENTDAPSVAKFLGSTIDVIPDLVNAYVCISSTVFGIFIFVRFVSFSNAYAPITFSPFPSVIFDNFVLFENDQFPILSTESANVTVSNNVQFATEYIPIFVTVFGTVKDVIILFDLSA